MSFNCLLKELFDVGVRGKVLSWFRSYLTGRYHRTVIDGYESSLLPISSGVPQGSILAPLLFVIYINMAPKAIHSSTTVQLYADDMKCFRIIDNTNDVKQLQSDLSNLNDWSVDHFLKFNSKCKYLAITSKVKRILWIQPRHLMTHRLCELQLRKTLVSRGGGGGNTPL